jgi:HTH-like domain
VRRSVRAGVPGAGGVAVVVLHVAPRGYFGAARAGDGWSTKSVGCSNATRGGYGSPRITADLVEAGWKVSVNTVAGLMRELPLVARPRHRRRVTTRPDAGRWRAPDLVGRQFSAHRRNRSVTSLGNDEPPPETRTPARCSMRADGEASFQPPPSARRRITGTHAPPRVAPPVAAHPRHLALGRPDHRRIHPDRGHPGTRLTSSAPDPTTGGPRRPRPPPRQTAPHHAHPAPTSATLNRHRRASKANVDHE